MKNGRQFVNFQFCSERYLSVKVVQAERSVGNQVRNKVKKAKMIGLMTVAFFCMGILPMLFHNIA